MHHCRARSFLLHRLRTTIYMDNNQSHTKIAINVERRKSEGDLPRKLYRHERNRSDVFKRNAMIRHHMSNAVERMMTSSYSSSECSSSDELSLSAS
jgi:hypothetical protein